MKKAKTEFLSLHSERDLLKKGLELANRSHECWYNCPCKDSVKDAKARINKINDRLDDFIVINKKDFYNDGRFIKAIKIIKDKNLLVACYMIRLIFCCGLADAKDYIRDIDNLEPRKGTDIL